eukprot:3624258-Rhodomonas_salina.1
MRRCDVWYRASVWSDVCGTAQANAAKSNTRDHKLSTMCTRNAAGSVLYRIDPSASSVLHIA